MSEILNGLMQAIDEQLQSPQTPYVRKTLNRLLALGLSEQQAREEMADCLGEELDDMLAKSRPFQEKSYRALLDALPWEEAPESNNPFQNL
jgi:hypothetical protein